MMLFRMNRLSRSEKEMNIYCIWGDLKEGVKDVEFADAVKGITHYRQPA